MQAVYPGEEAGDTSKYAEGLRKMALELKDTNKQLNKLRTKARDTPFSSEGYSEVVGLMSVLFYFWIHNINSFSTVIKLRTLK